MWFIVAFLHEQPNSYTRAYLSLAVMLFFHFQSRLRDLNLNSLVRVIASLISYSTGSELTRPSPFRSIHKSAIKKASCQKEPIKKASLKKSSSQKGRND